MNSAQELATLIGALRTLAHDAQPQAALATLVRTRGSTFRRAGTRMLVLADGSVVCELSGGCPQRDIVQRALDVMISGTPRLVGYNAESGLDVLMEMGCGGELEVLLEPLSAPKAMDFVDALAELVDHDPARLQVTDLPPGLRAVCAAPDKVRDALPLDVHSSVVVMTHNIERDMAYLAALRDAPIAYLGTLGSRERVGRMRSDVQLKGIKLHAPAGLDIGSETPEEIALAVAAEIMAVINGRSGGPLRDNEGAIH